MARRNTAAALMLGALAACSTDRVVPVAPAAITPDVAGSTSSGKHLVVFESGIPADFEAQVAALGGSVSKSFGQIGVAVVADLSDAGAAQLRATSGVTNVEGSGSVSLDPIAGAAEIEGAPIDATGVGAESPTAPNTAAFYPRQWHLRAIGAQTAWAAGKLGSANVRVFILDTGLGYTHPDLVGHVDLAASRSFVPSDDPLVQANFPGAHPVADLHYHGTHVGATVSSNAVLAAGVTSKVMLVGVKVLGANGSGSDEGVIEGILYAADADADVINMSLGSTFSKRLEGGAFLAAILRASNYAYQKGTLMVVSAGNANADLDHDADGFKSYCSASNVVCVSATGPTSRVTVNGPWTNIDAKATYSNYGASAITVAAPGGNTGGSVTAACSTFTIMAGFTVCQSGLYVLGASGTSMATPHVSGLAALLVEKVGRNNPAQLRAAIAKSSDDLGKKGRDAIYGNGRINVAKALGL